MRFDDPANPASWLLASFLISIAVTNLAWLAVRRWVGQASFRRGPLSALGWLAFSLFYLLPPFLALQRGVLSPYALGLTEINWPATLSNGLVLAALIAGGLLFGWLVYRRACHDEMDGQLLGDKDVSGQPLPPALTRLFTVLRAPLEAALHQWHWAFYRAALIGWLTLPLGLAGAPLADRALIFLQSEPLYWGAWLGVSCAGLEWLVDPFGRRRFARPGERETALRRAALAVATTGIFVLTRNFWLCLVVHIVVETLALGWFPLAPSSTVESH